MLDMKRCRWHVDDRPENVYVYSNNCLVCANKDKLCLNEGLLKTE